MPLRSSAHYYKFKGMHVLGQPWKPKGGAPNPAWWGKGQETIKEVFLGEVTPKLGLGDE